MKKVLLIICFFINLSSAAPAPLGFELNKATFEEVIQKYPNYELEGVSIFSKGKVIYIEPKYAYPLGYRNITFIFSKEDVLLATLIEPIELFGKVKEILENKYKMIKKLGDFDDIFIFKAEDAEIVLDGKNYYGLDGYRASSKEVRYVHSRLIEMYAQKKMEEERIANQKNKEDF